MSTLTGLEISSGVRHLVKERVDAPGAVPGEKEINVEGDLLYVPVPVPVPPWQHVPEPGAHSITEPERHGIGEHSVEPSSIEIAVERAKVLALLLGSATAYGSHAVSLS